MGLRATFVIGVLVLAACRREAAVADAGPRLGPEPAKLEVTKGRGDLVFTYVDPSGQFHDATTVDEVPEGARAQVLVRDLSKSPDELRSADYVYVADLREAGPDGRYPCGAVSRFSFDRRGAKQAAVEAAKGAAERGEKLVTVYSASWCGVCRTAKAWLRQKGVPYVERDVEQDAGASEELAAKAAAAGLQPNGVPVIDVAGELLVGFDGAALERLLGKQGLLPPAGR